VIQQTADPPAMMGINWFAVNWRTSPPSTLTIEGLTATRLIETLVEAAPTAWGSGVA